MRQYLRLLQDIINDGEQHEDRTGVGTLSLCGEQIRFDLRKGFPLVTTKRVPFRWVAEELLWMLSGSTDERELRAKGVDIWQEWATSEQCARFGRLEGDLGPVYGFVWRHFGADYVALHDRPHGYNFRDNAGVDQIAEALRLIREQPNSRRIIVSGWDARYADKVALPPCHTLFQFKVHEAARELSCHLFARSIDSFLGLPFNIAQYGLMLSLFAHVSDLRPRDLIISFTDVHLYRNHIAQAQEQLLRQPRLLPELLIGKQFLGGGLDALLSIRSEHLKVEGYNPHPKIEAPVAV